jgi:hypothetical protein
MLGYTRRALMDFDGIDNESFPCGVCFAQQDQPCESGCPGRHQRGRLFLLEGFQGEYEAERLRAQWISARAAQRTSPELLRRR